MLFLSYKNYDLIHQPQSSGFGGALKLYYNDLPKNWATISNGNRKCFPPRVLESVSVIYHIHLNSSKCRHLTRLRKKSREVLVCLQMLDGLGTFSTLWGMSDVWDDMLSTLQCSPGQCSVVQCSAVQCSAVKCSTEKCSVMTYSTVQ